MRPSFAVASLVLVLASCSRGPIRAQASSLADASFPVAWVTSSFAPPQAPTLRIGLGVDAGANPCPVVDRAVATVNGVPMHLDSPGGLQSQCVTEWSAGNCTDQYEPVCEGPLWSLANPPAGPLVIVLQDPSRSYEVDVGDMGSPRSIAVTRSSDGTPGRPGAVTLTWSPASDASGWAPSGDIYGMSSWQFGVDHVAFDPAEGQLFESLTWSNSGYSFPQGVTATGPDLVALASAAWPGLDDVGGSSSSSGGSSSGSDGSGASGGPGVFAVQATSLVRPTRCDWPNCTAYVDATATVTAVWHPF